MGWEFWFGGATILMAIFGWGVKLTTLIVNSNRKRDEKSDGKYAELHSRITTLRREFMDADEETKKMAGEVGHAAQSKIQQVELWARDHLVSKQDFRDDLGTITNIVDALGNRIERRLESFEKKLDELQKFNIQHARDANVRRS